MPQRTSPFNSSRLVSGASLVALAALAACSDGGLAPIGNLDATVTLDRAAIAPGDSVLITLAVTNRGGSPITLVGNGCLLRFGVRDAAGTDVVGPQGCPDLQQTVILGPGESFELADTWYGLTPVYGPRPSGQGTTLLRRDPVPPGTYTVTVRLDSDRIDFEKAGATLTVN